MQINFLNPYVIGILGLLIGSFLNVIIYRIPRRLSFIFPRSKCVHCQFTLKYYDLIPIFSWLKLGGKCRKCQSRISIRYPLVELLTSFLFIISMNRITNYQGETISLLSHLMSLVLISILICISFVDIDHLVIPNSLLIFGFLGGLINIFVEYRSFSPVYNYFFSAIIILIILSFISILGEIIFSKPIFGLGDAKLFSMTACWMGFSGFELIALLSVLFAGLFSLSGLLFGLLKRGQYIPYGPFICLATGFVWFWGVPFWVTKLGTMLWWKYL